MDSMHMDVHMLWVAKVHKVPLPGLPYPLVHRDTALYHSGSHCTTHDCSVPSDQKTPKKTLAMVINVRTAAPTVVW